MRDVIKKRIEDALQQLQAQSVWSEFTLPDIVVERPKDVSHGDWTTNVAFVLAKELRKAPYEIAREIAGAIVTGDEIAQVDAVQPGYVNFSLAHDIGAHELQRIIEMGDVYGKNDIYAGDTVTVEYTQPNPFKPFHIGHLMSNAIGESVSRIFEWCGADVVRANYQGDVGPHIAKALWGLQQLGYAATDVEKIGEAYAYGHKMSADDPQAKEEMQRINAAIYHGNGDEQLQRMYADGREKTLEQFEEIYAILGTKFDTYFFESQTWRIGEEAVREHIGDIFEESDGAIVFPGEKYGLHTRVFITAQGLPTYEAKEVGLALLKKETCPSDTYIITTAVEQEEYFRVVKKVIELIEPSLTGKIAHVAHGMMQLTSGKMSSRKGNVITGESLIADAQTIAREKVSTRVTELKNHAETIDAIAVAGIKFSILKQRAGKNVLFDPDAAMSFDGDSGPYIQYTYARCRSVLQKAEEEHIALHFTSADGDGADIHKLLMQFEEVVARAGQDIAPHHIANYLLGVAHAYNAYYMHHVIVDSNQLSQSQHRVALTAATAHIIKNGMHLLGIRVPEKM